MMPFLGGLPNEIQLEVCDYLSLVSLVSLARTCKSFADVVAGFIARRTVRLLSSEQPVHRQVASWFWHRPDGMREGAHLFRC